MNFSLIDKCVCLVAKRCSGKSQLLRYAVLCEKSKFDKMYCICPTERINKFYSDFIPDNCIFEDYEEEWVDKLIKTMTKTNAGKPKAEHKKVLLILDDVIADTNMHTSPTLKRLYARGRHLSISIVVTTQHLTAVSPLMRVNSDFILAGQMNRASITILCDEFMSGDIDRTEFVKLYNKATADYGFMVINSTSVKNNSDINALYGCVRTPAEYIK